MTASYQHERARTDLVHLLDAQVSEAERKLALPKHETTVNQRHYHRAMLKLAKLATGTVQRAAAPKGYDRDDQPSPTGV